MQMTEAEFFGQSIILWRRRIKGFLELHGSGEKSAGDGMSRERLEELIEEDAATPAQSAKPESAPML